MPGQVHHRVVMSGTIGPVATPFEIWSASLSVDGGDFGLDQVQRNAVRNACQQWFGRPATQISSYVNLREVAFHLIDAAGKQIGETDRQPAAQSGTGGSLSLPTQVALRVSLGSGLRGRSQKGGFYVPVPAVEMSATTGQISADAANLLLGSTVTLINDINNIPGAFVCIGSSVSGNVPVSLVRVGRRLDTIRRRANAIPEGYVAATVAD